MRINEHPRIALASLIGVFVLALTISLYFSNQGATGSQAQSTQVTVSANGNIHVVYVQYNGYCNVTFVSGSNYVHWHCFYND